MGSGSMWTIILLVGVLYGFFGTPDSTVVLSFAGAHYPFNGITGSYSVAELLVGFALRQANGFAGRHFAQCMLSSGARDFPRGPGSYKF